MSSFGFFGVTVDNSGDFFIEDAVVDIGLLGVEVLVEGGADDTIAIDGDSKLFGDFADVGVVPACEECYLRSPPSCASTSRLPPFSTYFLRSSISVGVKLSLGAAMTKSVAFLIFSKSTASLFNPI